MKLENKIVNLISNKKLIYSSRSLTNLQKNKVRVKIKAVGVCASDVPRAFYNGAYNYPLIMGHEISGTVFQSNSNKFKKNQKVSIFPMIPCQKCEYCKLKKFNVCKSYSYYGSRQDGGFAEFMDVNPWNIVRLPNTLNFNDAFAMEPSAVALNTVNKTFNFNPGKKKILVVGSGFIGLLITKIIEIKFKKSDISLTDRNRHKLNLSSKNIKKFLYNKKTIKNFTNKFDYIIDTTGNKNVLNQILKFSKNHGIITLMGNIGSDVTFDKQSINSILRKELKILGIWNSNFKNFHQDDWSDVIKLMKKGLRPSDYISHIINLKSLPDYLKRLYLKKIRKNNFKYLKVLVNND